MNTALVIYNPSNSVTQRYDAARSRILRSIPSVAAVKGALSPLAAEAMDDPTPLFACRMDELAGNIRFLVAEREKNKHALCQQLGIAKMRLAAGDCGEKITWAVWCKRFILNSKGKPYPQSACNKWAEIGLQPDVQAAYRAWKTEEKTKRDAKNVDNPNYMPSAKVRSQRVRLEAVAGPTMIKSLLDTPLPPKPTTYQKKRDPEWAKQLERDGEIALQVEVLMSAWDAACPQARAQFCHAVNLRSIG